MIKYFIAILFAFAILYVIILLKKIFVLLLEMGDNDE